MKNKSLALILLLLGCSNSSTELRFVEIDESIKYKRHEFRYEPVDFEGTLISFVYDVPYFGACGVFPPFQVINQRFAHGGGDGGMSPGASWEPFQISDKTYSKLIDLVRITDPKTLKDKSRYHYIKFIEAPEFDSIQDQWAWAEAVCEKYRKRYHEENAKIQDT